GGAARGLPLLEVVRLGDVGALESALADARQRGVLQSVLGERDLRRQTALHSAAAAGQWEMVSLLIDYGAAVNAVDGGGESPLHKAAGNGHAETVRALLNAGA
ncbi:ankyrin repeat-containing domain protein, partial [Baffinella frigidus]